MIHRHPGTEYSRTSPYGHLTSKETSPLQSQIVSTVQITPCNKVTSPLRSLLPSPVGDLREGLYRIQILHVKSSTYNIFMSGAHGVTVWVWCGGGWVSVDRQLFRRLWCLGGFGAVVFGTLLRLELEGSRAGILYDEIYITILN